MKTSITKNDLLTKELTHKYAGNGWMMIEDIDNEYCRITLAGPVSLHRFQAFIAWKPILTAGIPIVPETFDQVQKLRAEIKAGNYRIKETRLVKAKQ